jgi:rhodanese-related sulfurtransferase
LRTVSLTQIRVYFTLVNRGFDVYESTSDVSLLLSPRTYSKSSIVRKGPCPEHVYGGGRRKFVSQKNHDQPRRRSPMRHRVKILIMLTVCGALLLPHQAPAEPITLDNYLLGYNYESRKEMKATSKQALDWLEDGKAVLVDIRFTEEQQAWSTGFGLKIPLNELPKRLNELPQDKIIVAACPHKDRATIAMVYLRTKGFDARYLTDGLIGLMENLRGEDAKYFLELLPKEQP